MENQKTNKNVIITGIIIVIVIGIIMYALSQKKVSDSVINSAVESNATEQSVTTTTKLKDNNQTKKPMETNKRLLQNFTPVTSVATLQKNDLVVGTGAEVKAGATVSVHYTGAVAATGEVFQSSKDFGTDPITFPLSGVIKGWTDGIPGMKVGGTRRLVIPSAQAYGSKPDPRSGIPPNADLVFDVELVAVK